MDHRPSPMPGHAARRLGETAAALLPRLDSHVLTGAPADQALAAFYREHRELGSRDRRFLSALAFAWFRWRGWTALAPAADLPTRLAAAWTLDGLPDHPALAALGAASPAEAPGKALEDKAAWLAAALGLACPPPPAALVPDWIPAALAVPDGADPAAHLARVIEALQRRPPTWLRVRRGREAAALAAFAGAPASPVADPRVPGAWSLSAPFGRDVAAGDQPLLFQVQDLSSQVVALACNARPGESWWDACCGSGGKSLPLADAVGPAGCVLATDARESILAECRRRAREAGAPAIRVERRDPIRDGAPRRDFDGVLVDAPCSGVGTWGRSPDARWRTSSRDAEARARDQSALLDAAAPAVRAGGALVYAVCTLTRQETEGVAAGFSSRHPEFAPEPVENPVDPHAAAPGRAWVWPWTGPCSGMFIARWRRLAAGPA